MVNTPAPGPPVTNFTGPPILLRVGKRIPVPAVTARLVVWLQSSHRSERIAHVNGLVSASDRTRVQRRGQMGRKILAIAGAAMLLVAGDATAIAGVQDWISALFERRGSGPT